MDKLGDPKITEEMAEQELRLSIQRDAQFASMTAEMNDPDRELRLTAHRLEREARLDEILHPRRDFRNWIPLGLMWLGGFVVGFTVAGLV